MKKITLERAGLNVSNMCLGTMLYGTSVSKEEAFRQLDLYVSMGGNFLDTSDNYAHWMPNATGDESETLLGEWLKNHGRREDFVIATKVGYDRHGEGAGLTAKQIEYWCDESLRKLNLFPCGRLDKNTTGFVLLTSDGVLSHRVLAPKRHAEKIYYFTVKYFIFPILENTRTLV